MSREVALSFALFGVACTDGADVPALAAGEVPERQFVFERVTMEERRGERVLWTGIGRRADGDLESAWVEDVELRCAGEGGPSQEYLVRSPKAHLAFDEGTAIFEDVRIDDRAGGTLVAGRATYDEELGTIVADGPIHYTARGLTAHAKSAVVFLDSERVEIQGPVTGVYLRPAAPAPTPSPPAPPEP
jgi:hypothetical protein